MKALKEVFQNLWLLYIFSTYKRRS